VGVAWVLLEQAYELLNGVWDPLLAIDHPVSHETAFDGAVETVDQYPAHSDHPGGSGVLGAGPSAADPALEYVGFQAAVDYLVDAFYDFGNLVPLLLGTVSDVVGFDLELVARDDLAVAEPGEEAGHLEDDLVEMDVFGVDYLQRLLLDVPLDVHAELVLHLVLHGFEQPLVVLEGEPFEEGDRKLRVYLRGILVPLHLNLLLFDGVVQELPEVQLELLVPALGLHHLPHHLHHVCEVPAHLQGRKLQSNCSVA